MKRRSFLILSVRLPIMTLPSRFPMKNKDVNIPMKEAFHPLKAIRNGTNMNNEALANESIKLEAFARKNLLSAKRLKSIFFLSGVTAIDSFFFLMEKSPHIIKRRNATIP